MDLKTFFNGLLSSKSLAAIQEGRPIMERYSTKRSRLNLMKEIFQGLNAIPHDERKKWGSGFTYSNYDFLIEEVDLVIKKLDANLEAKKRGKVA